MISIAQDDLAVNRSSVRPISPALQAANERLLALRRKQASRSSPSPKVHETEEPVLPAHLGWGSQRLRQVIGETPAPSPAQTAFIAPCDVDPVDEVVATLDKSKETLRVYPSLLLGMLKTEQASAGRVWLLCRYLDQSGRGWLTSEQLREALTAKKADLKICGWRRLRQILTLGQDVYWRRDTDGRIWLFSAEKVAYRLHVKQLQGNPVQLSLSVLTSKIGVVRAEFFATFHSGRKESRPISRATLTSISGVAERTQRLYDRATNVKSEGNLAIGAVVTPENLKTTSYKRRHGSFIFIDKHGKQGPVGQQYHAWRLPNCYHGVHQTGKRGRQTKINRWLKQQHADLVINRAQGNGEQVAKPMRLFFDGERVRPNPHHDTYCFDPQLKLWCAIEPLDEHITSKRRKTNS